MALSAGLFGESFRGEQIAAGALLLVGAFLALSARPPVIEEPA
jgi:drug/metabolite transporter (DMT)-like permease